MSHRETMPIHFELPAINNPIWKEGHEAVGKHIEAEEVLRRKSLLDELKGRFS